jgi:hypothetical protein
MQRAAQQFERTYNEPWFDANFNPDATALDERTLLTSGERWEAALRDARKKQYPAGVNFIGIQQARDSEGMTMAYLRFKNPVHFRQWIAIKGRCNSPAYGSPINPHFPAPPLLPQLLILEVLPIIGPFLAFKKRRADGNQLTLPEFWKTLDKLRKHPDIVPAFLLMTLAPVRNDFLSPSHPEPASINLMLTAVKYMHEAIAQNLNRFIDIPGPSACLGIAIEDWMRAFCVLLFVSRKIGNMFAGRPIWVIAQPVPWGSPHEDQGAADAEDSSAERTAQSIDNINAADVVARTLVGETTDSGERGQDDDRAQHRMPSESVTTALLTAPGYPKDKAYYMALISAAEQTQDKEVQPAEMIEPAGPTEPTEPTEPTGQDVDMMVAPTEPAGQHVDMMDMGYYLI